MEETPFWLVWREGGPAPTRKHKREDLAEVEAIRLARENPGHTFYVLPVASAITSSDLKIDRFITDGIPF